MPASPTLGQLKTALQSRGYGTDTAAAQVELINTAYRRVLNERSWPFLDLATTASLAAGAESVTLTTELTGINAVDLTDGTTVFELEFIPFQELRHERALSGGTLIDLPYYWAPAAGAKIHFFPTPDKTYTVNLRYRLQPPKLVIDADSLVFPYEFQDTVLWAAIAEIATRQRDWNTVAQAEGRYKDALRQMVRSYAQEQRQTGREVQHWDYWDQVER